MAHFAKVVDGGKVVQVIVAEPEFFDTFKDTSPGKWIKTSYNMRGGVYYDPDTGLPAEDQSIIEGDEARQRKNFAGVDFTYDEKNDVFIPPSPWESWVLNEDTCLWEAPIPFPNDGQIYHWDEENIEWVLDS